METTVKSEVLLELEAVSCVLSGQTVIDHLQFHINTGEIACLLGPSGCGKTTTLRTIAGFQSISAGHIHLAGRTISNQHHCIPPEQRHLGMVFQDYALFPHLSIWENVCFGLHKINRSERKRTAQYYLELVGLHEYAHRFPHEISGGQQQRVALARALAPQPDVILLDEPFSNLDVDLRRRLSLEVRNILQEQGATALLVTHDQEEAFTFADKVGVMHKGQMQQWDTPYTIYHEPANRFVANFIGLGHFIRGKALSPESVDTELGIITGNRAYDWPKGSPVEILIRPDDIQPAPDSTLKATVKQKTFTGAAMLFQLELPTGSLVEAVFPSHNNHDIGEIVGIRLDIDHLVAFPSPTH